MPKDHVWPLLRAQVDTVWQAVSKYSFRQPARDGLRHWQLVSKCFFIVSSSKYVRSRVLNFLSETQRWDPKSTQALLIKKSDHSRYLYTHLQRHIKETQFQIPIRINKYTNTYEVIHLVYTLLSQNEVIQLICSLTKEKNWHETLVNGNTRLSENLSAFMNRGG